MSLPRVMSGVYLTRHGGAGALEMRHDIPVPRPGQGQVLVQVTAAGVNNTDINTRLGWYNRGDTAATDALPRMPLLRPVDGAVHWLFRALKAVIFAGALSHWRRRSSLSKLVSG